MVYLYACVHACKSLRILEEGIRSEEQQSQLVMNHPTLVLGFELQFSAIIEEQLLNTDLCGTPDTSMLHEKMN